MLRRELLVTGWPLSVSIQKKEWMTGVNEKDGRFIYAGDCGHA